ncbi:MAG: PHP domain-containing protein [Acidobacteria bacterium]|nr:PHP domain-containing protein [Acidobacteriota bacterium]
MVDLHSHTNRSDGSLEPQDLVELACRKGLRTLAITDHDTLEGYDAAEPHARAAGLELVCGVELSTKFHGRSIHVLGYFFNGQPGEEFRHHLSCLQTARRERNERLAARLRELGLDVQRAEAERLGNSQTGRPHFARLLVEKGYVGNVREAFDRYLDESAPGYVERREASLENIIGWIHQAGGLASWAHPVRLVRESPVPVESLFREMADRHMDAIEAYHSDHTSEDQAEYLALAAKLGLAVTGGSDFHGEAKPHAELGRVALPAGDLEVLRRLPRLPGSKAEACPSVL